MFFHIFKNRLKVILQNRIALFWTLIFPIVLATFFNLAFSNLFADEQFKTVKIAVVETDEYRNNISLQEMLKAVSAEGDNKVLEITYTDTNKADDLLDNNDISGYLVVNKEIEIVVAKSSIEQTILKSLIDQYHQATSTIENLVSWDPEILKTNIVEEISKTGNYLQDKSSKNTDVIAVYFYTIIGMVCLFGGFMGINAVNDCEGNLSKKGARISVSATSKLKVLLVSLLVSFIIQYLVTLLVIAYIVGVLGINFGNQIGYILLVAFAGCLAGTSLGTLIGAAFRKSEETKVGILTTTTLLLSFLSGMMIITMKYYIQTYAPILAKINPVNLITDSLYSLYYYDTYARYYENIFCLLIFSAVSITLAYVFIRRKKYDSI